MNQDKIGILIKELRKKSNLTQADFAKKYGVTYQAVSKWENGKNLPDMMILKQICNEYNINIDDILEGNLTNVKGKKIYIYLILVFMFLVIITSYLLINYKNSNNLYFEFKKISSNCDDFKISGSIAYNNLKSVIYISNIEYCGDNESEIYKSIESVLYKKNNNTETIIGTGTHLKNQNISLKNYLKDVTINVNNEQGFCNDYTSDSLYLRIYAISKNNKTITFSIPLQVESCN